MADRVSKMAEEVMVDFRLTTNIKYRPLHVAYSRHNVPCPHILCSSETGKVFYLGQRARTKYLFFLVTFPLACDAGVFLASER